MTKRWTVPNKPAAPDDGARLPIIPPDGLAWPTHLQGFQHHEGDDHAALVADGEMMSGDSELGEMVAQDVVEQQHRFAKTIMGDADALETDGVAHAAADGFGKCFLGGESLGEQARDVWAGLVFHQLTLAQHARRKTFAVTRPQRFDAGDFDDIGADSKYHA